MNEHEYGVTPSQDLFTEELYQYEEATVGQRLANFLIDLIFVRLVVDWVIGFVVGLIIAGIDPYVLDRVLQPGTAEYYLFSYGIGCINILTYYTFCERVFNGVTLGKLITGTRALREDGSRLSLKDAFLRSLSRVVPFEPFSGFGGHPWHDNWTRTMVVRK